MTSWGTSRASRDRWTSSASFIPTRLPQGRCGAKHRPSGPARLEPNGRIPLPSAPTRTVRPRMPPSVGCGPVPADRAPRRGAALTVPEAARQAVRELLRLSGVLDVLAERFHTGAHQLYLVGGSVRDALLGRLGRDLDFTTDAP